MSELIQRECLCGCGKTFRVLATNTLSIFYSRNHAEIAAEGTGEVAKIARKFLRDCIAAESGSPPRMRKLKAKRYEEPCQ